MSDISKLIVQLKEFRDQRDWSQFHNSKDLALAISLEASELNELFLWKTDPADVENIDKERMSEELADILSYSLLLADKHNLDVFKIVQDKIKKNNEKYPVEKSKGTSKKYNEL